MFFFYLNFPHKTFFIILNVFINNFTDSKTEYKYTLSNAFNVIAPIHTFHHYNAALQHQQRHTQAPNLTTCCILCI